METFRDQRETIRRENFATHYWLTFPRRGIFEHSIPSFTLKIKMGELEKKKKCKAKQRDFPSRGAAFFPVCAPYRVCVCCVFCECFVGHWGISGRIEKLALRFEFNSHSKRNEKPAHIMRGKFYFLRSHFPFLSPAPAMPSTQRLNSLQSCWLLFFSDGIVLLSKRVNSTNETCYWREYMKGRTWMRWARKNCKVPQNYNYTHKRFIGELRTHSLMQKYVLLITNTIDVCAVRPPTELEFRDTRVNYFLLRCKKKKKSTIVAETNFFLQRTNSMCHTIHFSFRRNVQVQ